MTDWTSAAFDPVAWWARVDGSRTAVIDASNGRRFSYKQLHVEAETWSARLAGWHVTHRDRVAILAQNRIEFIPLLFACIRRGAVLVPLNWRLSAPELARILDNATPALCLGEDQFRGVAEQASVMSSGSRPFRWIDLDRDVRDDIVCGSPPPSPARAENDAAMLLYTSGSTGTPKGVVIPHRQLLWNAIATSIGWAIGAHDVGPSSTPFFHTGGWNVFTTPLLFCGGTVVMSEGFDAHQYLEMLTHYRVTMAFGVPTQFAMMRETSGWGRPLPSLRTFLSGGAPCPQQIKDDARAAGYLFREGYGLTECGPNCFATNDYTAVAKDGSVGWPMPFLNMRLCDEDDAAVAIGDTGELQLRGPQLFGGYFNAPERTAEVMTADGWLRTGDLASRDSDGVYTIRGRRKDMFISGGENVFPGEVEMSLLDCPGIADVIVVGVPDDKWGEVGCAVVVSADSALTEQQVKAFASTLLAKYKVPKHVHFVPEIPRLGSGKHDRRSARETAAYALARHRPTP